MALYLVENAGHWVEPPIYYADIRKGDTVIAEFHSDLFYTDEEKFELFAEFVRNQEGKDFTCYRASQLKELYAMWLELQKH